MAQCENHEAFVQIALDWGWLLWEHGQDTSCERYPELVPIWLRPVAWDEGQKVPVGCLCCTDLDEALMDWNAELISVLESRRREKAGLTEDPDSPPILAPPNSSLLPPYRAR